MWLLCAHSSERPLCLLIAVCAILFPIGYTAYFIVLLFEETNYQMTNGTLEIIQRGCCGSKIERIPLTAITLVRMCNALLDPCLGKLVTFSPNEKV